MNAFVCMSLQYIHIYIHIYIIYNNYFFSIHLVCGGTVCFIHMYILNGKVISEQLVLSVLGIYLTKTFVLKRSASY